MNDREGWGGFHGADTKSNGHSFGACPDAQLGGTRRDETKAHCHIFRFGSWTQIDNILTYPSLVISSRKTRCPWHGTLSSHNS